MFNNRQLQSEVDSLDRKIDLLTRELADVRKSMCVRVGTPTNCDDMFYIAENFHAVDIKRKFEQIYDFLDVKLENQNEKLVKKYKSSK